MSNAEPKGVHGMLVLGEETVYLSHLPMFMAPHDFQVLLEVTLKNETGDAQQAYAADRRMTGTAIYTLEPEAFHISDLVADGERPRITSFTGTLFRGHFERGGTKILDRVTVEVDHVIHFRQLDHRALRPAALTYLAFGKRSELFLSHLITAPPDFDHLIAVQQVRSVSSAMLTDNILRTGRSLAIVGRVDRPEDRLQEGDQVAASFLNNGSDGVDLRFVMGREFYVEEGELATRGHSH